MNLAYDIWMDQKKDAWLEGKLEGKLEGELEGKKEGIKVGKLEGIKVGKLEGMKVGRQEGEERYSALIRHLLADGREQDLKDTAEDSAFREKLYEEYQIE